MPKIQSSANPAEKLHTLIKGQFEFIEAHPNLARVYLIEMRQSDATMRKAANDTAEQYLGDIRQLGWEGQAKGLFNDAAAESVVAVIVGATELIGVRWLLGLDSRPLADHAEQLFAVVTHGLLTHEAEYAI